MSFSAAPSTLKRTKLGRSLPARSLPCPAGEDGEAGVTGISGHFGTWKLRLVADNLVPRGSEGSEDSYAAAGKIAGLDVERRNGSVIRSAAFGDCSWTFGVFMSQQANRTGQR
mmetsp:Transcript_171178/g.416240  ORF Transcript_171178/g.416240 Transcript_171178/m.416240 type:complete len:113 (-) Transcript_171178:49-387(-)